MKKIKIALDVDEVLADCIPYAIRLYNEETGANLDPFQVTGWGKEGDGWTRYFNEFEFVQNQPVLPGAKSLVKGLLDRGCDVLVMTAVPLQVVPARVEWLKKNFPEIDANNIIIGKRKDVCAVDILIDDGAHNILSSPARFPILMRKPWNQHVTGVTAVNGFEDCLNMIDNIMRQNGFIKDPKDIICLIGPSGSGKTEVTNILCEEGYIVPQISTTSTKPYAYYKKVSRGAFEQGMVRNVFAETTSYAGEYYGITVDDMNAALSQKRKIILPTDICGANALARIYGSRVATVYLKRAKADLVSGILKKEISDEEKSLRILALDNEVLNEELCDYTIDFVTALDAARKIMEI